MTLQEAIETVENGEFWDECIIPCDNDAVLKFHKALDVMIAELQARQEPMKLDRSGWEKCNACSDEVDVDFFLSKRMIFCPYCGRPVTEEAWAKLERRKNDGKAD